VNEPGNERLIKAALTTDTLGVTGEDLDVLVLDDQAWEAKLIQFQKYHQLWSEKGFIQMLRTLLLEQGVRARLLSYPAGERLVPAVVRRLEEHRLPELVVAAVAGDPDVSHAAAAPGRFPGRFADARRPAHLRLAGPQLVTERAALRLALEQRNGHLNDHAVTSGCASMITAA